MEVVGYNIPQLTQAQVAVETFIEAARAACGIARRAAAT